MCWGHFIPSVEHHPDHHDRTIITHKKSHYLKKKISLEKQLGSPHYRGILPAGAQCCFHLLTTIPSVNLKRNKKGEVKQKKGVFQKAS